MNQALPPFTYLYTVRSYPRQARLSRTSVGGIIRPDKGMKERGACRVRRGAHQRYSTGATGAAWKCARGRNRRIAVQLLAGTSVRRTPDRASDPVPSGSHPAWRLEGEKRSSSKLWSTGIRLCGPLPVRNSRCVPVCTAPRAGETRGWRKRPTGCREEFFTVRVVFLTPGFGNRVSPGVPRKPARS